MKVIKLGYLIASLSFAGCMASSAPAEIRVTTNSYEIGEIKSNSAKPIADQAKKMNPKAIMLMVCNDTPPEKVAQLTMQIRPDYKGTMQMQKTSEGCGNT